MTVTGILIGSIIGNGIMYLFAKQINQYITPGNVWVKIVGVILLVALFGLVEIRYRFVKKKYMAAAKKRAEKSEEKPTDSASTQAENPSPPTDETSHS